MDVILDSNEYLQDFRMEGTQFQELFTYLRRTDSWLVVPRPVLLEAARRYRDMLSQGTRDLKRAWDSVRQRSMRNLGEFESPVDIDGEVSSFEQRLREPAPRVRVSFYDDYSSVSLEEVVRRGVERIKPASEKGEELRDVILWLMVLAYARKCRRGVAFISNDGHFRSDGGLHETLASDVAEAGAEVSFYRRIGDFIAGNSLEIETLTEKLLFSLVSRDSIEKEARKSLEESRELGGRVLKVEIDALRFSSGKRYKVAEDSFYVESVLTGTARAVIRQAKYMTATFAPAFEPSREATNISSKVFGDNAGLAANAFFREGPWYLDSTLLQPAIVGMRPPIGPADVAIFNGRFVQTAQSLNLEDVEILYRCRFQLDVSARIQKGRLVALQTEGMQVAEMEPVPDLGSPDSNLSNTE